MDTTFSDGDNANTEINYILEALKKAAKELHVPIVALSQLNVGSEKDCAINKQSQLINSLEIGQHADVVVMLIILTTLNTKTTRKLLSSNKKMGRRELSDLNSLINLAGMKTRLRGNLMVLMMIEFGMSHKGAKTQRFL